MYVADTPPESPVELRPELPIYLPAIQGCRNVEEFRCINRIEEGTYGVVYRAKDKKTGVFKIAWKYTVDGFIFLDTNFHGLNKSDSFMVFKNLWFNMFLHQIFVKLVQYRLC